jgi:peptidoglycan/xylan/chitin deacetylase (PgdA/CDA1 family)
MDRRGFLAGAALALSASPALAQARAPGLAITIDDFDLSDTPLMTGAQRHAAILGALDRHEVRAAGFMVGKYVDRPGAKPLLDAWSKAGHLVGNHTYSHAYCPRLTPAEFETELMRSEAVVGGYPSFRRLFRFPFLAEGNKAEARDGFRAVLDRHGYRNGHVTIDTSDWYIDNRLKARLAQDPATDLGPYRRYYLDHLWERAAYYDGLAGRLGLHGVDHTLLLHHRLTTGLFLHDTLDMFRDRGWRLVDAETAFAAPLFGRRPAALPAGQSLIWSLAKESGRFEGELRYPGEDEPYEKSKMDALGL